VRWRRDLGLFGRLREIVTCLRAGLDHC
jgi:hypothetical protein